MMERHITALRVAIIGELFIIAAGRLGLVAYGQPTRIPDPVYGGLALMCAFWLLATIPRPLRVGWLGRIGAALSAGVFFGLAVDVLPAISTTMTLVWFGVLALWETVRWRNC